MRVEASSRELRIWRPGRQVIGLVGIMANGMITMKVDPVPILFLELGQRPRR